MAQIVTCCASIDFCFSQGVITQASTIYLFSSDCLLLMTRSCLCGSSEVTCVVKKLSIYHFVLSSWQNSYVRKSPESCQECWPEMDQDQAPHSLLDCLDHHCSVLRGS